MERIQIFSTIFLGIFIEAAPFLLLGTLASGAVEVFLSRDELTRWMPRSPFLGAVFGGMMGFFFPVCECGVVPFTRRLFKKGLPPAAGISFLLAAPVLNPIVIASTYAAFGAGPILYWRVGLSFAIALAVGLVFTMHKQPARLLRGLSLAPISGGSGAASPIIRTPPFSDRIKRALRIAGDEFFEMGRYLILGSLLAAAMQTIIPQPGLLALGTGPVMPILVMMALAVILSVCSTVDAFIALAFVGNFPNAAILAFLIFGPMIDIKNVLMFLQVFRRRTVLYLVLLPLLMTFLVALYLNLFTMI